MFKNYLKLALRNIFRQKLFSIINILGLATGMACSILILLWIQDEISFDIFNKNAKSIYRVVENQYYAGGEIFPVAVTPGPLAAAMKEQYPEVVHSTRITFNRISLKYREKLFSETILLADSSFLEMFTFPLIMGDYHTALSSPFSIIITEKAAQKYFGEENPIGKSMFANDQTDLIVTGVLKNVPENSHLKFDFVVPFKVLEVIGDYSNNWSNNSYYTYVQLLPGVDYQKVNDKIKNLIKKNNEQSATEIYLQPLLNIHLYSGSKYTADLGNHGNIEYVNIFFFVALFVLLIACINFMNLATARSTKRAKEVGLRKVVGAVRSQIIKQFLLEAILLTFIAFVFAIIIVKLLLPAFNELSGKLIEFSISNIEILGWLALLCLITGIIAGSYPALYLSSFQPAKVLKESKLSGKGGALFRKIMVIFQFALSIILLIGTAVVYRQLDFIQNKNLGFQKDNILYFQTGEKVVNKIEEIKSELIKNPKILSVTASSNIPTYYGNSTSSFNWEGKNPTDNVLMHFVRVDLDYIKTFQMKMAEGRFFSKEFVSDSDAVIVNETAIKVMGIKEPIGKRLSMWGDDFRIIGIVKDFNFKKLETKIEPLVLRFIDSRNNILFARIDDKDIPRTIDYIERTVKGIVPSQPVEYVFLDEQFDILYKSEQIMGKLFSYFAILAVLISCLGLFGLASFMAERRIKEIGIRKAMGASIFNITVLLSVEFSKWILIANIIAWPVSYFFMKKWLQDYAYRIELNVWLFIISGILALLVALITVSYQALKAATANPINALKYE